MMRRVLCALLVIMPACIAQAQPLADHHQHLFSPALAALISPPPPAAPFASIDAADVIRLLDEGGFKRAVVLPTAYIWGQPTRTIEDEYEKA